MCYAKPGPRCSPETYSKLQKALTTYRDVLNQYGENDLRTQTAFTVLKQCREEYDTTPAGLDELKARLKDDPADEELRGRLLRGQKIRDMQLAEYHETRNGRRDDVAVLTQALVPFYDQEESVSIIENAFRHQQHNALKYGLGKPEYPVSARRYGNWVKTLRDPLETKYGTPLPEHLEEALQRVAELPPPDYTTLQAYKRLPDSFTYARKAMITQLEQAAALQDVEPNVAAAYFEAYRDQYKNLYANLPAGERPDPPAEWVDGSVGTSGFRKAYDSQSAPHDPASMYALYRLRSDPDAIPASRKNRQGFVSVDLETALPDDINYYLNPAAGRIIEVGARVYDADGNQQSELQLFVKPEKEFLDVHGTGAEHVHNISRGMLENAPAWDEVRPQVQSLFTGRTLLAQNADFERTWLAHYMEQDPDWNPRTVDTLLISRKHYSLPTHNLATVCAANNVEYTEGHRALHDAQVTGDVFFAQREHIKKMWNSKKTRKEAPVAVVSDKLPASRWNPPKN